MRRLTALAASAACLVVPMPSANAATVQLDSTSFDGTEYTFSYGGTLAPTEGVKNGSKLVILDFLGYVDGSIFSPYSTITATTEMTSSGIILAPMVTDDPDIPNLVFTYIDGDFQTEGGPFSPINFAGLVAKSIYAPLGLDGFATLTVKNDGEPNTPVYSAGLIATPGPVPEPATWGLMLLGFTAVGWTARRRHSTSVSFS